MSPNANEDVDSIVQDIAKNIRLSQDLFDSSTPAPEPEFKKVGAQRRNQNPAVDLILA